MNVTAIVACSKNRAIGRENQIPWYLPADLQFFKRTTSEHHILMGRKTYESIGRPLPKRTNMVITRQTNYKAEGCVVLSSLLEGVEYARKQEESELFIIGGGEIYRQSLSVCNRIYYTEVDTEISDATVFFPPLESDEWALVSEELHEKDEKNPYNYKFKVYERINPVKVIDLHKD
jgi:dihydrofolate reductase